MTENEILVERIRGAVYPKDVFGGIDNVSTLKHTFNSLVRTVHPDTNPTIKNASELLSKLIKLKKQGIQQLQDGSYSEPFKKFSIELKRRKIEIVDHLKDGSLSNVYKTSENTVVRISKDSSLNNFFENEMDILRKLKIEANKSFTKYIPDPLKSYKSNENLKINELNYFPGYQSIEDLMKKHPNGIDMRSFAWIANRLFEILGFVHYNDIIHGGVLPSNILIETRDQHALALIDWTSSTKYGYPPKLIVDRFEDYYPKNIDKNTKMSYIIDTQMAVNVLKKFASTKWGDYDGKVKRYFEKILTYPTVFSDAWDIRDDLEELWKVCIGKKKFFNEL